MEFFTEMPHFDMQKVIIDGLEAEAYYVGPHDSGKGLTISFFTPTKKLKKKAMELYGVALYEKKILFTLCRSNYTRVAKILSSGWSGEKKRWFYLRKHHAMESCTLVFDLKYEEYKDFI